MAKQVEPTEQILKPVESTPIILVESDPITRKRKYKADLVNGCWLEVEFSSYSTGPRHTSAMLYQARDRWLIIRFDAIPNKLLDASLVESLMLRASEMMKVDHEYISKKPDEFIDKDGVKWLKAPE